ncbi:MAG: hypothetical protein AAF960_15890 [Bacteroidota bacterium]
MRLFLFCCCLSLTFSNYSCKKYTPTNLPAEQIHFGEGGGFTGAVIEFCLLENGQLMRKKDFLAKFAPFKKVKKKVAKECFQMGHEIPFETMELNNPGDRYYFIQWKTDAIDKRITWGRPNTDIPKSVATFYQQLKSLTKIEKSK